MSIKKENETRYLIDVEELLEILGEPETGIITDVESIHETTIFGKPIKLEALRITVRSGVWEPVK